MQDEVQGFHWNNLQCTLHPVVVYYKDGDALQSVSYCIISDDNKHDVEMVYQVQMEIITDLKLRFPYLSHVTYFYNKPWETAMRLNRRYSETTCF